MPEISAIGNEEVASILREVRTEMARDQYGFFLGDPRYVFALRNAIRIAEETRNPLYKIYQQRGVDGLTGGKKTRVFSASLVVLALIRGNPQDVIRDLNRLGRGEVNDISELIE